MFRVFKNHHFRDNTIFIAVAIFFIIVEPAIVRAQPGPYNPVNFTETLSLSRGNLSPSSPRSAYLSHDDSCRLVQKEFGWEKESCTEIENIIFRHLPGIDTLVVEKPNSGGYVKFDDWDKSDAKDEIDAIWQQLVEGSKAQSKSLGYNVVPIKWTVYPKLDKQKSYMYYAILMDWNGDPVVNIKASLFDRRGYIPFRIVPIRNDYSQKDLTRIVETTLNSYSPKREQSYFDFRDGDKVAAAGAIGVLATLVGVKYGKAIATGFVAILLVLAKKLWFLVFIIPVVLWGMIKRFFSS